ncbi:hypothetical protein [Haliovirga abyssi]|uniref:Lipoprotein n=1 Tax=Haliovirga abyssi TaxID=2996794 RepID=A0AAU9DV27_9FUSO|nr:hypothetical protein [Haliovirga abyssi]BDU49951.1 hypothetical protein HLVA_05200 [Haliovirga abyssi]
MKIRNDKMRKIKRTTIVLGLVFSLIGCFSSEDGCANPKLVTVFPKDKTIIQTGDSVELLVAAVGADNRLKTWQWGRDYKIFSIIDYGTENIDIIGDVIKAKKRGLARIKVGYKPKHSTRYYDSPILEIKDNLYKIRKNKQLNKKPKKVIFSNNKLYMVETDNFILKLKEYDDDLIVKSEEDVVEEKNIFFDNDLEKYTVENGILKNISNGKELEISKTEAVNYYLNDDNKNYLLYKFKENKNKLGEVENYVDKVGIISLKNMSKILELDDMPVRIYYGKEKIYLISNILELEEGFVIKTYDYSGNFLEKNLYSTGKLISDKVETEYKGKPRSIGEKILIIKSDGENLYVAFNTDEDRYPGGNILCIDKNSLVVKSHKHINGYFISDFKILKDNIIFSTKTTVRRILNVGIDNRNTIFVYDKNSYNMKFMKNVTSEKIDIYNNDNYLYILGYSLDDYNCEIEQIEIY